MGLNLVVLCWSNDTLTIPLAVKIWKKGLKKSKYDLAPELLSYARNILLLEPEYVAFDSWYAAKKILKRLKKYHWIFYTHLRAQVAHVYMSLMAFVVLERAKMQTCKTWYALKRELTFHPQATQKLLSTLNLVSA